MARTRKPTASEVDGVQYRRARTWQIALSQLNTGQSMTFYLLIGMMSYLQNAGYGIAVAIAGVILTATRVLDAVIDPVIAFIIDRVTFSFGKLRFFLVVGWVIRTLAVLGLFVWGADKGLGLVFFLVVYAVYILGSSINDIAGNMVGPVMTNDPRQRPVVFVWSTIYSYFVPIILTLVTTLVILPKHGNEYTVPMLQEVALLFIGVSVIFLIAAIIGTSDADRPESFAHLSAADEKVTPRDMWNVLRHNGPFARFVVASVSDKLAQQVGSQAVVATMLYGILIGNIQLGTIMSTAALLPSIVFAIFGAKYTGKHGARKATIVWTWVCIIVATLSIAFCMIVDLRAVLSSTPLIIGFVGLLLILNGAKMCVTTAGGAMRADVIDYELDRSGKYLPGVVVATYNFIDQLVSSLGASIALGGVALIGYTAVMPQPTDDTTPAILWMTLGLFYGIPILGWVCTLLVMPGYKLDRTTMIEVQKRIADKKVALAESESESGTAPEVAAVS